MFRGGITTLLRESVGNSVFFCTYEFSRSYLQAATRGQLFKSKLILGETQPSTNILSDVLLEAAIATTSGGLAGIAVSRAIVAKLHSCSFFTLLMYLDGAAVLGNCATIGCSQNADTDFVRSQHKQEPLSPSVSGT